MAQGVAARRRAAAERGWGRQRGDAPERMSSKGGEGGRKKRKVRKKKLEKKISSFLIPQPSMADCNCQAGLKAGQGWCKESGFLQSPQKPPLALLLSHSYCICPYEPVNIHLNIGFYPSLSSPLPPFSSAERLAPKEFKFLGKQSFCMCSDHVLSPLPSFGLPFLFCASYKFPASWHWQERPYQYLYQGQVYYTQQDPHESELDLASSELMQLVFPNLLAWDKTQANTLQRTFHLTQFYATDLSTFHL